MIDQVPNQADAFWQLLEADPHAPLHEIDAEALAWCTWVLDRPHNFAPARASFPMLEPPPRPVRESR